MRPFLMILVVSVFATPAFAEWNKIDSKQELTKLVVGKNYAATKSKAWFQLRSNGKLVGKAAGKDVAGRWKWSKGRVCYARTLGGEKLPDECVIIHVDGDKMITTRQSNGSKALYLRAK